MPTESEEELITAAKNNKQDFIKLYDRYFDPIYKFLLTRVTNLDLAEDLTSETFFLALENIDRYQYTGKPFSAWLYRIAINEMNRYFRRHKKEKQIMEAAWPEIFNNPESADTQLKENENQLNHLNNLKELNTAFKRLKPDDQNLLSLRYFQDLSYQEISNALNLSLSNVGVKLNRALKRLSQLSNASLS
ncbi:MAG: heat shock and oxidative stress RNA polymerase sigma-E factor, RNA polymerase sigma-70 factor, ECF subfamily [Candidatus Peregrinibacteria bacterium GW2011_GWE2_39_6]|nr:MAG: heat shock and oxidative stress RNA polymerase sigma-E factor, RNA polymerase sigma-70 factor, ECF subfamily [Candidatus Peregrinibacteria bacterium GW2011_GWF2_39_17]KKR26052.1 MAG: heat shock and oxidative stress RNA polymerase sigma-E factor, RNA polymerase sigma-70 factor, ECF subfamily [Candidatus Peregrinibacteria bacterium GW2011_GWE2_39_6]HCW32740.1 hypothetical protein [Candidatus Peregrinibacteria bacterium]